MPVEINLGERFGKITIVHEKSLSQLVGDLKKDTVRIRKTMDLLREYKNTVKPAKGMLPERILIADHRADTYEAKLTGYDSIVHELYLGIDGTLIEEVRRRPLKHGTINLEGIGRSNLEDTTNTVDPKFLPDWLSMPQKEKEFRTRVRNLFYPGNRP